MLSKLIVAPAGSIGHLRKGDALLLSELPTQGECQLCVFRGWRGFEGRVQPSAQVSVDKELVSQQSHKIGQRPAERRQQLQVSQQKHCDQRRPDLRLHCVRAGSQEGLDLQVLLDRLEEQLDLPAVLVDGCDRRRTKLQVVGEKDDGFLLLLIPVLAIARNRSILNWRRD